MSTDNNRVATTADRTSVTAARASGHCAEAMPAGASRVEDGAAAGVIAEAKFGGGDNQGGQMALPRLLQLVSPALPVGAYSFSQGLEYAVEAGWVGSEREVGEWLSAVMRESLGRVDLPLLLRCMKALGEGDRAGFDHWNDYCLASRESAEFLHADREMGKALRRLLAQLHGSTAVAHTGDISFTAAFALAAGLWEIAPPQAAAGYLWSWLENQVTAATKIVPFGQSTAQRLLWRLAARMPPVLERAAALEDGQLGGGLPRLAIASARHETQYTRLYRS